MPQTVFEGEQDMKKALLLANAASMLLLFNRENIRILQQAGYEVHVACNFKYGNTVSSQVVDQYRHKWEEEGIVCHQIDFLRTPFSLKSLAIYRQTKRVMESEDFDMIHCHTPIVSAFARLVSRLGGRRNTRIIYTAHGFHFHKGASLFNWLVYYPIEWLLAPNTDVLLTINAEDYAWAKKHLRAGSVYLVPGIGIDTQAMGQAQPHATIRQELGLEEGDTLLFSVGELSKRKNHQAVIRAMHDLGRTDVHYVIAGVGGLEKKLRALAGKLGLADRVHLLGYRRDIYSLLKACDIFCFPSYREGLPVAVMEAMACGVPMVASEIRGNTDLIEVNKGGFLCRPNDHFTMAKCIGTLLEQKDLTQSFVQYNLEKIRGYDRQVVAQKLRKVYLGNEASDPDQIQSGFARSSG